MRRLLLTGATGKVGQHFLARMLADPRFDDVTVRALCHHRLLPAGPRLEIERGSIADPEVVRRAMQGVTHVLHMATCKETPADVMDVTVKGLFWLLEECRTNADFRQFLLIGGDASMGHFFYPHPIPVTEEQKHSAYPGCYALSKVLEEVMLEQYGIQYDLNGCCLRAPWIMEKDDFRYTLSFGDDLFGGPDWKTMMPPETAEEARRSGAVPILLEADGTPVKRNFVHVEDLVEAIALALTAVRARQRLYNICMDEPVDYAEVGAYLAATRGLPTIPVRGPYVSNWMDNARARAELGWRPRYDLRKLIDAAWDYQRPPGDPRKVWYPG